MKNHNSKTFLRMDRIFNLKFIIKKLEWFSGFTAIVVDLMIVLNNAKYKKIKKLAEDKISQWGFWGNVAEVK